MNIIVQTYAESNPGRMTEYNTCLINNLNHFFIKNVYNLYESEDGIDDAVRNHPKYRGSKLNKRMTYQDAFAFANSNIVHGEIVGILNLDIYVAHAIDFSELSNVLSSGNVFLALSRHEIDSANGPPVMDPAFANIFHANTQDGWFFKNPIKPHNLPSYSIELGRLGCDNAIVKELKNNGYCVFNLAERFVLIHLDKARGKNGTNFMKFHGHSSVKYNIGTLVPNYDAVRHFSSDQLMKEMRFTEQERVLILSEIINMRLKINN
jgi:hypothetical protein